MLVIIHFRKYHIWNMRRKRTDQSIHERRDVVSHQVRPLAQRMADKPGKRSRQKSPTKLSKVGMTKRKEILVSKTEQEQNWQLKQLRANRWG